MYHSDFDEMLIEFSLEYKISGKSLQIKANEMAKFAISNPSFGVLSIDGQVSLQEALVRRAIDVIPMHRKGKIWDKFLFALQHDGFVIDDIIDEESAFSYKEENKKYVLRKIYPEEILNVTEAQSETLELLEKHDFNLISHHLKNAIDLHSRGKWDSANGDIRKVFEGFLDEVSDRLNKPENRGNTSMNKRLKLLSVNPPFLSEKLNELRSDGKQKDFIQGLMNRLHPEGGHPGLSNSEDSAFRLHIVVITIRMLLKRYEAYCSEGHGSASI